MKKLKFIVSIFLASCFLPLASSAYAQEATETPITSVVEPERNLEKPVISAEEYILMPGDSILITITGSTYYSYITGITYEGKTTINLPVTSITTPTGISEPRFDIVEAVPIYNLSLKAAKDSLKNVFLKYFKGINIDITLLGMRTFIVYIAGEVKKPGIALARPIDRVSSIIDTVGSVTAIGSRSKIELRRGGKLFKMVNLSEFEKTGNTELNPYVQDRDLIFVPRVEKSVTVIGAVYGSSGYELTPPELSTGKTEFSSNNSGTTQGIYELIEGEKVSDILTKARITPWADLANIYILRKNENININFPSVLADQDSKDDILMEDGDILYVPRVNAVVYVQGSVANPGPYAFQPNLKASDYIGMAGGSLDEASITEAYVRRGTTRIAARKDPIIEQGDKIIVPRQLFRFWQDYFDIITTAGSLVLSYLTLRAITK